MVVILDVLFCNVVVDVVSRFARVRKADFETSAFFVFTNRMFIILCGVRFYIYLNVVCVCFMWNVFVIIFMCVYVCGIVCKYKE